MPFRFFQLKRSNGAQQVYSRQYEPSEDPLAAAAIIIDYGVGADWHQTPGDTCSPAVPSLLSHEQLFQPVYFRFLMDSMENICTQDNPDESKYRQQAGAPRWRPHLWGRWISPCVCEPGLSSAERAAAGIARCPTEQISINVNSGGLGMSLNKDRMSRPRKNQNILLFPK